MIEPILTYGSDLWGASSTCTEDINKIYLWFIRLVLNVKATTSNKITMGEAGIIPPRIKCHENVILYFIRLNSMRCTSVVRNVFIELERLHQLGDNNWYSKVLTLAKHYNIDVLNSDYCDSTKKNIKKITRQLFVQKWMSDLHNVSENPSLRTYNLFKTDFSCEPYLSNINKTKHLIAFTRFRAGSHTLEIERGRYSNPRTPINERLCVKCREIEDEQHFLMRCSMYKQGRIELFDKTATLYSSFQQLSDQEQFIFLMSSTNSKVLSWTGKFIHCSMHLRATYHLQQN